MSYLPVTVYRDDSPDSTNGGITSEYGLKFVVPCPDGHISKDDIAKRNYLILEVGEKGGELNFTPAGLAGWSMFGGNFVYTSDSRFSRLYGNSPVAVHDRQEA